MKKNESEYEICVISQRDSHGMREFCLMMQDKFGLGTNIENVRYPMMHSYMPPTDDPERIKLYGNVGCFASHRRAIENAKERGTKYLIVFEHDCTLIENPLEFTKAAIAELETYDKKWKCINLGGCRFDMWFPEFPFVQTYVTADMSEVRNMTTTHGIVYNVDEVYDMFQLWVPSFEEVISNPDDFIFDGYAQDLWLSRQGNYYTAGRAIAFQTGENSTIGNVHSNIDKGIEYTYSTFTR